MGINTIGIFKNKFLGARVFCKVEDFFLEMNLWKPKFFAQFGFPTDASIVFFFYHNYYSCRTFWDSISFYFFPKVCL